jgi:hypothetical protein
VQSKNKPAQTLAERVHVARVKQLPCAVCDKSSTEHNPSEAHEVVQGLWWLSIPLCSDCHRGAFNGLHGQRHMWRVSKKTELSALNDTIRALLA